MRLTLILLLLTGSAAAAQEAPILAQAHECARVLNDPSVLDAAKKEAQSALVTTGMTEVDAALATKEFLADPGNLPDLGLTVDDCKRLRGSLHNQD